MRESVKRILIFAAFAIFVFVIYQTVAALTGPRKVEVDSMEFWNLFEAGLTSEADADKIDKIVVGATTVELHKGDTIYLTNTVYTEFLRVNLEGENGLYSRIISDAEAAGGDVPTMAELRAKVKVVLPNLNSNSWLQSGFSLLGFAVLVIVMIMIMRQMGGGGSKTMNFGRVKTKQNENVKVKFSDVAGAEEEKEELREIVEFLKSPKKFAELGARIPKGVLLVGPPGTGKTLFAKAVAGEANVPFFSISGSDFVEMFVGVGASRVRDLFELAKKSMPCIIFIDEIDAVGRQRGTGMGGGHDEREQTLNQLLVQMDGFESNESIIIMAATNRADILDPALMRPGRFDRQIYIQIPDVRGREAIFKVHARNKPLSTEINFRNLARMTSGFTGADIENLLNEAAILAARAGRKQIIMKDIYEGINKVIGGPQKKSRLVTETDKRITAFHEAGHAILAKSLKHTDPVHEVSVIPRGRAAGYTVTRPDTDDNHVSRNKLLDHITMMLGGYVAEELVIEDICTGSENDLQRATALARKMVTEWGMSSLGAIYYGAEHELFLGRDFQPQHTYSEQIAASVDAEINKIMKGSHGRATDILKQKGAILENMARVLMERETIISSDVDMLMNGATVEEVEKHMDDRAEREQREAQAERRQAGQSVAPQKPEQKPQQKPEDNSGGNELPH